MIGRLLLFNALGMKFCELNLRRDPACPICGDNPTIKELIDYDQFFGIQPAPAEPVGNPDEVTVQDMKKALDNPNLGIKVIDVRSPREIGAAAISWGKPEVQPAKHAKYANRDGGQNAGRFPLADFLSRGSRLSRFNPGFVS